MFGALNRLISRLDADGPSSSSTANTNYNAFGFQVLRNKNTDIAIEPWYDFIIGINGRPVDSSDPNLFATEIRNCAGSNVAFTLWGAKGQRTRSLSLPVPPPNESPTLGLTLQWTPLTTAHNIWHILSITPYSPASTAGLLPYSDYIVGSPEGAVYGEAGLGELVEDYISRSLRLWVYNHEYGVTRLVSITPSRSWGGEGALGCVLGFGALHRLPPPLEERVEGPGEMMFETAANAGGGAGAGGGFGDEETLPPPPPRRLSSSTGLPSNLQSHPPSYASTPKLASEGFLVPANLMNAPPPPAPVTGVGAATASNAARKPRKGVAPGRGFDDMFKEGEEKSREEDRPSGGKKAPAPPPPRAGAGAGAGGGGGATGLQTEEIGEPGGEEGE